MLCIYFCLRYMSLNYKIQEKVTVQYYAKWYLLCKIFVIYLNGVLVQQITIHNYDTKQCSRELNHPKVTLLINYCMFKLFQRKLYFHILFLNTPYLRIWQPPLIVLSKTNVKLTRTYCWSCNGFHPSVNCLSYCKFDTVWRFQKSLFYAATLFSRLK